VFSYITNGQQILNASGWDKESDGSIKIVMDPPASAKSESRIFGLKYKQEQEPKNEWLLNSGFKDNAETIKEISTN
jgi:hypothetical protein